MKLNRLVGAATVALAFTASSVFADNKSTVTIFYDLLSNPGDAAQVQAFQDATSQNWESIGDYSGNAKTRDCVSGAGRRLCPADA